MPAGGPAKPGDRLRILASEKNDWNQVAAAFKQSQRSTSAPMQEPDDPQDGIVMVKNGTSSDVPAFGVLGLGQQPLFDANGYEVAFKYQQSYTGETPAVDNHDGRFCVFLQPCPEGQTRPALIVGATPVQVDITDNNHRFATVADGDIEKLVSAETGSAQILSRASTETGVQWCYVRLGNGQPSHVALFATAVLTAALTTDTASIGTFAIASPPPFDLEPDTAPTSAANPRMHRGKNGDKVLLARVSDTDWEVIDVEKHAVKIAVGIAGTGPLRVQSNKIQGYMATLAVEVDDDPEWEDLITGATCDP